MKKIIEPSNIGGKIPKRVDIDPKTMENSKSAESVGLMFFWNMIPLVLRAYRGYFDTLNTIYSMNTNFIKCDQHGRKEKESGK